MNFFICNRYDSKRENFYVLSSKLPNKKNNLKKYKSPILKNLLLEEINNLNKNRIPNIDKSSDKYSDDSGALQIIDYPYAESQPFIKLKNRFSNKFKYNSSESSIDEDKSYYNCFHFDKVEENTQITTNKNRKKEIYSSHNNSKNKFEKKLKLDDSQIDIEDTIKGEDNININKLKLINKRFENKKKANNIKLISKNYKKGGIKHLNDISLNNYNKLNINEIKFNNNTFIKKRPNINILNKSLSKNKKNNNTLKSTNKIKTNLLINSNESLNSTYKIDNNKLKKNNNNPKIDNYYNKIYNKNNNIKNINKNKDIILAIKKKIQKDAIYRANNIINKNKQYKK